MLGSGTLTLAGPIQATANGITEVGTGVLALTASNAFSGGVNIDGGTLSADSAGALGTTGAVTINPGGTLRTLATGGANLGGGNIALNDNGILQAGNGSTASVSATMNGVLTYTGNTYINLADKGASTATLVFSGATTSLLRTSGATLILNGATALDGAASDLIQFTNVAGGLNNAQPTTLQYGVLPGYEVGTVGLSSSAGFLTSVSGTANIAGANLKLYTGYVQLNSSAGAVLSGTSVYQLTGASTITSGQAAFDLNFNSGASLALGANNLNIGGGGTSQGGIIFNGNGDSITGTGPLNPQGGELAIYTAGTASISDNISSGSGGPFLTFFGPGTLTLTGSSLFDSNTGGPITVNGNVIANIGTPFSGNAVTVNNGTFTLGLANIFNGTAGSSMTVTGGTLDLHGNPETVSRLQGGASALVPGGTITSSQAGGVLILANDTNGDTFYGNITSANLGFTKYGSNIETLSGLENYGGTTTINGGQLTFAPLVAGVNDSLGALAFAQGLGTVQSTFLSGTTTLTFSNVLARTAGATGNFVTSGGANGTTNDIVLTQFNGSTTPTGTLLDKGLFYNGGSLCRL